jgi:DNA-directed RNA polymerase specialized sigma24 family protein
MTALHETTGTIALRPLGAYTDAVLASRAVRGDGPAFSELARRYRGLIRGATQWPPVGLTCEDLRQEALIGLLEACHAHDAGRGGYDLLAGACVRNRVRGARRTARRAKHRVLSDALSLDAPDRNVPDDDGELRSLGDRVADPVAVEPARVVATREQLAEISAALRALSPRQRAAVASEGEATAKDRYHARQRLRQLLDRGPAAWTARTDGRLYSQQQVDRALALVANGHSLTRAGAAVGANRTTVLRWLNRAA